MSDTPITNVSDHSVAKRRLVRDLRILVVIQIVALCIFCVSCFAGLVPNYPEWDRIYYFCASLLLPSATVFIGTALVGSYQCFNAHSFKAHWIRIYAVSVWGCLPFVILAAIGVYGVAGIMSLAIFSSYCIIPQYFIARWLAKEVEDAV
jgi:hypothetical protein